MIRDRINVIDYCMERALTGCDVPAMTREQIVEFLGTQDISGIELCHAYWADCSPQYIARLATNAGKPIRTYIFYADLAVVPDRIDESVSHAKRLIDRSVEIGARQAMIVPAQVKEEHPLAEQTRWMIEGLTRCAEHAGSCGLLLLSENIDDPPTRPMMGTSGQCRAICDAVGSPNYKLIYDPGTSILLLQDPLQALDQMAPHIAHVHLKNITRVRNNERWKRLCTDEDGQEYRGVLLTEGEVNYPAVLKALKQLGFEGQFALEYQGEGDPHESVQASVAQATALLTEAGF